MLLNSLKLGEFGVWQIKSKERVSNHGEVFTNKREVNAMLDMVQGECGRIESRFLERITTKLIRLAGVLSLGVSRGVLGCRIA